MKIINEDADILISREDFANILLMIDYIGVCDGSGENVNLEDIEENIKVPAKKLNEYIEFISKVNDRNNYREELSKCNFIRW